MYDLLLLINRLGSVFVKFKLGKSVTSDFSLLLVPLVLVAVNLMALPTGRTVVLELASTLIKD